MTAPAIPDDVMRVAADLWTGNLVSNHPIEQIQVIARAILAERQRCACVAKVQRDDCASAVRAIDHFLTPTATQAHNLSFYRGGRNVADEIYDAILAPAP